jgi:DNA repair ATPase RecN
LFGKRERPASLLDKCIEKVEKQRKRREEVKQKYLLKTEALTRSVSKLNELVESSPGKQYLKEKLRDEIAELERINEQYKRAAAIVYWWKDVSTKLVRIRDSLESKEDGLDAVNSDLKRVEELIEETGIKIPKTAMLEIETRIERLEALAATTEKEEAKTELPEEPTKADELIERVRKHLESEGRV